MKWSARNVIVAASLCVAGCIPEKRIVWSPDGKTAAVCAMNGLYFINADGNLLAPKLTDTPVRCAWFKDNRRLVIVHISKGTGWKDIAGLFDESKTAHIKQQAATLKERILAYEGDWDKFKVDPDNRLSPGQEEAVFTYVRDNLTQGLPEKLGAKWNEVQGSPVSIWQLQLFELAGDKLLPGKMLLRTLDEIHQPKISPNQLMIGLVMTSEHSTTDSPSLHVIPSGGGPVRFVTENVAMDYDWGPTGQSLAFISSTSPANETSAIALGSLTTLNVANDKGELLAEWAERSDRVGLLFNPVMGVRWLSDGRLMFSSAEVTLPATNRDMPQRWSLFIIDPKMPASVIRALGRDYSEPLDPGLPLFELSPDEKSVLLPGPKGRLSLYDLKEGKTTVIQGMEDPDGKTRGLASWRNGGEICFISPRSKSDDKSKSAEVMLRREDGKLVSLSKSWPDEVRDGWLMGGQ